MEFGEVRHRQVVRDQAETLRLLRSRADNKERSPQKEGEPTRVISITSGKGGVGKTLSTLNLAVSLAKQGKRVAILDGDLGLANIDVMVGLRPVWTLEHVISGEKHLEDIVIEGPEGVRIIPGASGVEWLGSLNYYQRLALMDAIEQSEFHCDYLLIDTPAGIGQDVMFFNSAAHETVVVVTPDVTSITDAYALIKVLNHKYREHRIGILVNGAGAGGKTAQEEGREVFARISSVIERFLHMSISYIGFVPAEELVRDALGAQRVLVDAYPGSDAAKAFLRIAKRVDQDFRRLTVKGGMQFFFQRLIEAQAE